MLTRLALRVLTVKALMGKTLAGESVRDSRIPPIDEVADDERRPFIAVYTDDGSYDIDGRNLVVAKGEVSLVLEIGVTSRMQDEDGATDWGMPVTDPGMEITLDIIERQARQVLTADHGHWAELWRRFAMSVKSVKSIRGASAKDGIRFAGRQVTMQVATPSDPPVGQAGPIWASLLSAVEADPDMADVAAIIHSAITGTQPDWQRIRGSLGLTLAEARALQIAPPQPAAATAPTFTAPAPSDAQPEAPTYGYPR